MTAIRVLTGWRIVLAVCLATTPFGVSVTLAESRSIDGTGNHPSGLGAANTALLRVTPAAYPGDGSGDTIIEPTDRPNPRDISNAVFDQGGVSLPNDRSMTDFVWQWGQFLDHDIDLTGTDAANGSANIPINNATDPLSPTIPFTRSHYALPMGIREQVNEVTAFIDGSGVYGSDDARATWLRTLDGGKLKVSSDNLLPLNDGFQANAGGSGTNLFVAGDVRANEQIGLTAMHTLFVREHNRLADLISTNNPLASDEDIYQSARKLVAAEIQAITYNEFLPALLGPSAPSAADAVYDSMNPVDPTISNEFSTASYRFGHSMLASNLQLVDNQGASLGDLPLRDAFFNPSFLVNDPSQLDALLKGLSTQKAQEIDLNVVDDVRNFLFGPPGAGGLDLVSLNIQRGRDHGLADYNTLRQELGLGRVDDFDDISADPAVQDLLSKAYGDVDRIDPWVGGLAEDHLANSSVGELVSKVLIDQFTWLRDGDRFFFSLDPHLQQNNIMAILDIGDVTLAEVIRWNTDITQIQDNVFYMENFSGAPNPNIVPTPTALWAGLVLLGGIRVIGGARTKFQG